MKCAGSRDAGSIVVGWLVKIALVLAVLGVGGFDAITVTSANLTTTDDANSAASAAASEFHNSHNVASAVAAANAAITNADETILPGTLVIGADGTVRLRLTRKVTTLVMRHIGPLRRYTVITVTGEGSPTAL